MKASSLRTLLEVFTPLINVAILFLKSWDELLNSSVCG